MPDSVVPEKSPDGGQFPPRSSHEIEQDDKKAHTCAYDETLKPESRTSRVQAEEQDCGQAGKAQHICCLESKSGLFVGTRENKKDSSRESDVGPET